jgi:Domain of unknown function (DUF4157)
MLTVHIKENALLAKCAAWCMHSKTMAITINSTIYLHGTTIEGFLENKDWLLHELAHVHQFKNSSTFIFIAKYLLELLKRGYFNNKYEIEARANEKNNSLLHNVQFVQHLAT